MRKIPIYDITEDEITSHILRWEPGIVNAYNLDEYVLKIKNFLKCSRFQHLEISRNSNYDFGRRLRTAFLKIHKGENIFSAEALYQGSKVLYGSGLQHHLYDKSGEEALGVKSRWKGKKILGVDFFGYQFNTSSLSDLHDFLYWLGLEHTHENIEKSLEVMKKYDMVYFTDCFDAPLKNSQSQSFAKYFWRWKRGERVWDFLTEDQKRFLEIINNNKFEKREYLYHKAGRQKVLF